MIYILMTPNVFNAMKLKKNKVPTIVKFRRILFSYATGSDVLWFGVITH